MPNSGNKIVRVYGTMAVVNLKINKIVRVYETMAAVNVKINKIVRVYGTMAVVNLITILFRKLSFNVNYIRPLLQFRAHILTPCTHTNIVYVCFGVYGPV